MTTQAAPLGGMGYCELQPVGHCNLPVHTMCASVVTVACAA